MMLENKVAVIYGAGGAVGGAVARAYAREGAKVFLTGRHLTPVESVAKDILSAGGHAETAEVDALDERAVDTHLQSVIDKAGRVDVSFNAVGIPNTTIQGVPLTDGLYGRPDTGRSLQGHQQRSRMVVRRNRRRHGQARR